MTNIISPEQLSAALQEELTIYHKDVTERINKAGQDSMNKLVKLTKASAPTGKRHGKYRASITSQKTMDARGNALYTWGAKGKEGRLTHLLVHGHAARDGGRVPGNPFLQNALDVVLPEYEKAVEEALKND